METKFVPLNTNFVPSDTKFVPLVVTPVTTLTHTSPTKMIYNITFIRYREEKKGGGAREILNFQKYFFHKLFLENKIRFKKLSHIVEKSFW
jgi:1-deoxy-D-xylulose 5-phosphate reductoisomerase